MSTSSMSNSKQNRFSCLLKTDENMFQRKKFDKNEKKEKKNNRFDSLKSDDNVFKKNNRFDRRDE